MHRFNYVPRLGVLQFMDACETFMTFKKEHGELTPEEEEALRSCIETIHALVDQSQSAE
jgi:hypothetical protein